MGNTRREALDKIMDYYNQAVKVNDNKGFLVVHTYSIFGDGRFENQLGSGVFFDKPTKKKVVESQ